MLTTEETQAAQAFWAWFEQNRLAFEFVFDMSDEQRAELFRNTGERVSVFAEGLEMRPSSNMEKDGPKYRAVISAAGHVPLFKKAKALADLAPAIPDWTVSALMPPLPKGVKIRFDLPDGGLLYPEDVWFLLMEAPDEPKFLGLHLALKQFDHCADEIAQNELKQILIQLVAYIIGEESWAMDIQHLQIGSLPPDPFEEGFIELYDLPEYIAEFRKENPSPRLGEM